MLWEKFFLPADLTTALQLKTELGPEARFVAGGTDIIVDLENGRRKPCPLIDISRLAELHFISEEADGLRLGGGITHVDILQSPAIQAHARLLAQAAIEVGAPQIRNRSTIAGNLVTASPAADTVPPLLALGASVELVRLHKNGNEAGITKREIPISEFITGFRKVALAPDELVRSIFIPFAKAERQGVFLKLGLRKAQAISVVSVSIVLDRDDTGKINRAGVALGSVAATPLLVPTAANLLVGQTELGEELIVAVAEAAMHAASPIADVRGSALYRKKMVKVFTTRALHYLRDGKTPEPSADPNIFLQLPSAFNQSVRPVGDSNPTKTTLPLELELNGQLVQLAGAEDTVLLYALRQAGYNGTKEGCFEGECGACTVLLDGRAVNSCLVPAYTAHGCQVTTVEGLATGAKLHPLQQTFVEEGGVQCGYCTPGLLMAGSTLLAERAADADDWQLRSALVGNLCRCTGYSKVLAAMKNAQEKTHIKL